MRGGGLRASVARQRTAAPHAKAAKASTPSYAMHPLPLLRRHNRTAHCLHLLPAAGVRVYIAGARLPYLRAGGRRLSARRMTRRGVRKACRCRLCCSPHFKQRPKSAYVPTRMVSGDAVTAWKAGGRRRVSVYFARKHDLRNNGTLLAPCLLRVGRHPLGERAHMAASRGGRHAWRRGEHRGRRQQGDNGRTARGRRCLLYIRYSAT